MAGIPLSNDDAVQRSPTVSKDLLAAAEEILKLETADPSLSALPDSGKPGVSSEEIDHTGPSIELDLPDELEDFPLPTVAKAKAAPVTSTFSMSVGGKDGNTENINNNNNVESLVDEETSSWEGRTKLSEREKFKSEVSFPQNIRSSSSGSNILSASPLHRHHIATTNINNISFDSGQGGSLAGGENSASLASSVSSSTSSLGGGTGETDDGQVLSPSRVKGRYARDFDVGLHPQQQQQQQQQKKKWSVTLDPFSPQAEIVNKTPEVEIQVTDVSNSPVPSSPSQTSTPLSHPPPRERPLPVHMIGTTSEAEVPESRTEFNTDGNVELPSVNRLKALFSSQKDDMLGDGNFKRVHSITARSVSKQQLEKLKSSNQPSLSSLPPSIASAMSSSDFASRSPLSISQTTTPSNQKLSSSSLKLNLSSSSPSSPSMQTDKSDSNASMVSLRHVPTQQKQQQPEKEQRRRSLIEDGSYLEVDDGKDPVLIYPERDPEYWKRQHKLFLHERQQQQQQQSQNLQKEEGINLSSQQLSAAESTSQAPSPPQSSSSSSPLSPVIKTSGTSPGQTKSPRPSQPRLIVRRATSDINLDALETDGSGGGGVVGSPSGAVGGTRIKAGCISARAAFWEKRMMEGGETVAEDEFPEMVEEPDS
ncbi:telokin [Plakobranchus ocellatus]|uniref:Telokin n=1 Tax=Plakobranchus ocellatus TaxID=259542 RepID=A0AAV4AGD4_9GAST|nr:telokin [Plakobranchus ocellatus]